MSNPLLLVSADLDGPDTKFVEDLARLVTLSAIQFFESDADLGAKLIEASFKL
jgi:hypothetical protein